MKMTPAELALVEAAGQLWNDYLQLLRDSGDEHPSERQEMCQHIHSIQQRIMARLAARVHPDVFGASRSPTSKPARCAIPAPSGYRCDQPPGHKGPCGSARPGRKGVIW